MSNVEVGFFSGCNVPAYKFLCNNRYRYSTLFELYHVVQFYPWSKFSFLLFQNHYYTLPYHPKKEKKIETNDKIEPQLYTTPKNVESCGNVISRLIIGIQIVNTMTFLLSMLQPYTRKLLPFWVTAVVKQFMQENAFTL